MSAAPTGSAKPLPGFGLGLCLALAAPLGCGGGDKPAGAGGDGAGDGGSPDTAAVDCATTPLDCDGEDNDCDGVVDEGGELDAPRLWGVDNDHDGYPAAAPRRSCAGAEGEVEIAPAEAAADCDDHRFGVHPGAEENCVAVGDEDCSGLEGCADPACAGRACTEICDDGVDNDRDGSTDCADSLCWRPDCPEDCATAGDEDDDGEYDCQDADCWGPACGEICSHVGDEDADGLVDCADPDCVEECPEDCREAGDEDLDGLADCEDADCVEECVEVCGDLFDNDMDGTLDCADVDCAVDLRCWSGLDLRAAGPIRLQRYRHWDSDWTTEDSWRRFTLEVPTVSIVGGVMTVGGVTTPCTLRAHEVEARWLLHILDGTSSFDGTWVSSSARVGTVGPPEGGCPPIDVHALIADQLRLKGYLDHWFRGVTLLDVGRTWALDELTIGPSSRRSGAHPFVSTRGPYGSEVVTYWIGGWERSTTTATAVGFAPVP